MSDQLWGWWGGGRAHEWWVKTPGPASGSMRLLTEVEVFHKRIKATAVGVCRLAPPLGSAWVRQGRRVHGVPLPAVPGGGGRSRE